MGIEPPTSCVESREGNHYTTSPWLRLGLGLGLWLGLEYHNPNPNPNPDPSIISAAEGRPQRKFFRGGVREVFVGGHFSSELFNRFAAESARIRSYQKIFLAEFCRIRAEPGRVRTFPRGFARNRDRRSSAEPIADFQTNLSPGITMRFQRQKLPFTCNQRRQTLPVRITWKGDWISCVSLRCGSASRGALSTGAGGQWGRTSWGWTTDVTGAKSLGQNVVGQEVSASGAGRRAVGQNFVGQDVTGAKSLG